MAGLERYIDEMRANDEGQEPWFLECAGFIQELREQWPLTSEQKTEKTDCVFTGEDVNMTEPEGYSMEIGGM